MKKIFGFILMLMLIPTVKAADYKVSIELENKEEVKIAYNLDGKNIKNISTSKKEETTDEYGKFNVGDNTEINFNSGILKLTGGKITFLSIKLAGDNEETTDYYYIVRDYALGSNSITIKYEDELKILVNENGEEKAIDFNICDEEDGDTKCYTTQLDIEKDTIVETKNDNIPMKKNTYYQYMIPFAVLIVIGIIMLARSKRKDV